MNKKDERNFDFKEVDPLFSYSGRYNQKTIEGAYMMFSALFEQAEAGKLYRVHVGSKPWVMLEKYLYICSEAYSKPAEFVKASEINTRRGGYTFVQF